MKYFILTTLLTGIALFAGAQESKKMTKKEKEEALQGLKMYYNIETGQFFNFSDGYIKPRKAEVLPWQKWANEYKNDKEKFKHIVEGFEKMQLEAISDRPDYCLLVLRSPVEGQGNSFMTSSTGFDRDFSTNSAGHRIGFHQPKSGFCDFGVNIDLHLTDRSGKPVFIHPEKSVYFENGYRDKNSEHEAYSALMLPLTVPFSEVVGGHIDVRFDAPEQYEWVTLTEKDIGCEQTLCGVPFRLERFEDGEFIISASYGDSERLGSLDYFYHHNGSIWDAASSSAYSGSLVDMMKSQQNSDLTFEKWLAEKGIDPNNLKETIGNLINKDEHSRWGKRFASSMKGDALLLYMPVDSAAVKPLATAQLFIPEMGKPDKISVDQSQVALLQGQLLHADAECEQPVAQATSPEKVTLTEETPAISIAASTSTLPEGRDCEVAPPAGPQLDKLIRRAKSKLSKEAVVGYPPQHGFNELTNAESDALLADNDRISYAAGVMAAKEFADNPEVKVVLERYRTEAYPIMYEWFGKGLKAHRQVYLNAEAALGDEGMDVYRKNRNQDLILKEIEDETDSAKKVGEFNAWSFEIGTKAFMYYRYMAVHDDFQSTLPTGKRMDMEATQKGFRDYFERSLTQGLQYSLETIPKQRRVKALHCNDELEASVGFDENGLLLKDFKPAEGWNPYTKQTEHMMTSLQRELRMPQEALENGILGKVLLEVVAEADGAISQVIVKSSPDEILSRAALDAVYRVYMRPAMVGNLPVAFRMSLPIIFTAN